MAHLFVPNPSSLVLPVFFNVDGVVGANPASNKREDVLLVQFAFSVIAKLAMTQHPAIREAAKDVRVTGIIDEETIVAIRTMQKEAQKVPGGEKAVVDGRVSRARGYDYGTGLWTIFYLNDLMQNNNVDIWPRIDKIPGCPAELKQMVIRTVAGK